jgi:hypothetical protein
MNWVGGRTVPLRKEEALVALERCRLCLTRRRRGPIFLA